MDNFPAEIIAILAVGIALAGLILQQGRRLDRRIDALTLQVNEQFNQVNEQFNQVNEQIRSLGERVARLEGKLDFLEGFITRRNEPPVAPAA